MKHVIVGTAGHIDHGKTTLIHALTGRNTDRLKEEQKRGISIDLGFTYFDLNEDLRVGIIDVPGHEKFIKNMLAGVVGMDMVILVVAADEGVMPQTREHLEILNLIGMDQGFTVMTKIKAVDEDWLDLVEEDIREELEGSFLAEKPILRIDSIEGIGLDEVKEKIQEVIQEIPEKSDHDMPRLYIDRSFSISGFGTVVTGTLLSGSVGLQDELEIYPSGLTARVRSLQVHDEDCEKAYAGQRVAINLAGIKKQEAQRGMVLAPPNKLQSTKLLDIKIETLDLPFEIKNRTRFHLYLGTEEVVCRGILLNKETLDSRETAYMQLILEEEIVAKKGDRFILRLFSPLYTIGGGKVLDPNPKRKKRFNEKDIENLKIKDSGESKDILLSIIDENSKNFPLIKDISKLMSTDASVLAKDIEILEQEKKIKIFQLSKDTVVISLRFYNDLVEKILNITEKYHNEYPLREGILKETIRSRYLSNTTTKAAEYLFERMQEEGYFNVKNDVICLKDFKIGYNTIQAMIRDQLLDGFSNYRYKTFKFNDVGIDYEKGKQDLMEVINAMIAQDILVKVDDFYLTRELFDQAIDLIRCEIQKNGQITISEARDLLDTNRKTALAILEYMDDQGITIRDGDYRKLN